jgi:hypothetical protein
MSPACWSGGCRDARAFTGRGSACPRIRHTQPDGRVRWLESVVSAEDADALVWSTNPTDTAVFDLAGSPRREMLAWFAERVARGEVELIEEKTA